jgi:hypothetical protein
VLCDSSGTRTTRCRGIACNTQELKNGGRKRVNSMIVLLLSPASLSGSAKITKQIDETLARLVGPNVAVCVVSNHSKPVWFDERLGGTDVEFIQVHGRQSGGIVRDVAKAAEVATSDVFVLVASNDDLRMAKNGNAIVLSAQWIPESPTGHLGIDVANPVELELIVRVSSDWPGGWWYEGDGDGYDVRALTDLSQIGKSETQQEFAGRIKNVVKDGGANLNALLAVTSRSLLKDLPPGRELLFGVYPSSDSNNKDSETLSDFTHRLRTTVTRVHFAKRGVPLFVRHMPSVQRHRVQGSDRADPNGQVGTVRINRAYVERIPGRHVVVVDDCVTYGVSFGVAAALLKAAGAASVTGVALGKFGSCIHEYSIELRGEPFKPVKLLRYTCRSFTERTNPDAQALLNTLLSS